MAIIKDKAYVLVICNKKFKDKNNVKWPDKGVVEDPNWDPNKGSDNKLHGHLWGCGKPLCYDPRRIWIIAKVDEYILLDGTVAFPKAEVVKCGRLENFWDDLGDAVKELINLGARAGIEDENFIGPDHAKMAVGSGGKVKVGDYGIAASGQTGRSESGKRGISVSSWQGFSIAGSKGVALSGDYGKSEVVKEKGRAYSGNDGTAITGDYGMSVVGEVGFASSGDYGESFASYAGDAVSGKEGLSFVNCNGIARAGEGGVIILGWYDYKNGGRKRYSVGYVGENGIEPDTWYYVEDGEFVIADPERGSI